MLGMILQNLTDISDEFSEVKILGCSKYETVPIYEAMDIIQSIAEQMGKHCAEVDYLLWMYCANGYGEVCTVRNPKCDICVIRNICNSERTI